MSASRKLKTVLNAGQGIALTLAGIVAVIGAAYLVVWLTFILAGQPG